MDNLTPELFLSTCLQENARRLSVYDQQLLQPQLMPALAKIALRIFRFMPRQKPNPTAEFSKS
ncbi:hypothetical protein [Iningainema tapete]|uniref:Uncharacterized protein n=1 Tax=Iningainema tapete BLCC-T55 TaxID=2748662 RepID=A0A8J6XJG6_9CYAN|nr:hypothetical protein [Iningainema tapete]MBD2778025.1 hypothetical protein [Iningainema tapete BLCC-T55]